MFSTVLRVQARVYAFLAIVTFVVVTIAGFAQAAENRDLQHQADLAAAEAQFWTLVAGDSTSVEPSVENLLARDLQLVIDDPELITRFRAPANRYGGITDAIGVDPFAGTATCSECGFLSDESMDNLRLIIDGRVDDVVADTVLPAPDSGLSLTPLGLGVPSSLLAWYLLTGIAAAAAAEVYLRNDTDDRADSLGELDWDHNSVQRTAVTALSPLVGVPYIIHRKATRKKFADQMREAFPEQVALIEQTDRALERVNDPATRDQLLMARNEIARAVEAQTRGFEHDNVELRLLTEKLRDANEFLRYRSEALDQ